MNQALTFGGWVRQRRKALDFTQEHLAEHIGCAVETIRKIESGRRRPSRQMVELLAEHLSVPSGEWPSLVQFARLGELFAQGSTAVPSGVTKRPPAEGSISGLPVYLTAFVGRGKEIEDVISIMRRHDVRLLTLTGAGGSGKTRLAVQAASRMADQYKDGICFVPLASVEQPSMVISAVGKALGMRQSTGRDLAASLRDYLHNKRLLLVLDNFEHVSQAALVVGQLLNSTNFLKVLVTSREPLHLYGEQEYHVPPLALPAPWEDVALDEIARYEAVELFVRRARAVKADFSLSPDNASAVVEICRRVDGLPLAIELVVSRISVLPPRNILSYLDSSLHLLTGGPRDLPTRQQTLRSCIDWSYRRLGKDEKWLFRGLGAFANGFTLGTVEAIFSPLYEGTSTILDLLESLADKSLLLEYDGSDGEPRFTMLQTIRDFARECLYNSGEATNTLARYAEYYMVLAESAEMGRSTPDYAIWLERLEAEHDNIQAALHWCRGDGDTGTGLRLAAALTRFWYVRGYIDLAYHEFMLMLDKASSLPPSADRVKVYAAAGEAALEQERVEMARLLFEAGLEDAREVGETRCTAGVLLDLGCSTYLLGDCQAGRRHLEEALSLMKECNHRGGVAVALLHLGEVAQCLDDMVEAHSFYSQAIQQYRDQGALSGLAFALYKFGNFEWQAGRVNSAHSRFCEGLALSAKLKYNLCIAQCLMGLAAIAASSTEREDVERSAVFCGASEALVETRRVYVAKNDRLDCEPVITAARRWLGDEAWDAAWAVGRSLSIDEAIEYALEGWVPEENLKQVS